MPHPFDIQPPSPDNPGPRFTGNVVEMPRRYIHARRYVDAARQFPHLYDAEAPARAVGDGRAPARPPLADLAQHQRESLARFYRANPQFGPRPRVWQVVVAVAFVYALLVAAMVLL